MFKSIKLNPSTRKRKKIGYLLRGYKKRDDEKGLFNSRIEREEKKKM